MMILLVQGFDGVSLIAYSSFAGARINIYLMLLGYLLPLFNCKYCPGLGFGHSLGEKAELSWTECPSVEAEFCELAIMIGLGRHCIS